MRVKLDFSRIYRKTEFCCRITKNDFFYETENKRTYKGEKINRIMHRGFKRGCLGVDIQKKSLGGR